VDVAVEDVRTHGIAGDEFVASTSSAVDLGLFPVLWGSGVQADKHRYFS
jgi:hypothetical protein